MADERKHLALRAKEHLRPAERGFIERAMLVQGQGAVAADALGFSTRVLVQASLPHRAPRNPAPVWIRRNGNFALQVQPGYRNDGTCIGLPFGNIPRLILTYISTWVVQEKSREVDLGRSLATFMGAIGLHSNGLHIGRLKDQMMRLFSANISFAIDDKKNFAHEKRPVARRVVLWWDEKNPAQEALFRSSVLLDEEFFREIMEHPVPVDLRAVAALKHSSLALDLYAWLTHRVTWLERPTRISWEALQEQMGSEYASTKEFARNARAALRKVHVVYPELNIQDALGGFILKPSRPHVARATPTKLILP